MRLRSSIVLDLMRNALAARLGNGLGQADDPLLLNGVMTLVGRSESGLPTVERIRDEVKGLVARIAAVSPHSIETRTDAVAVLVAPPLVAGMDPVAYFQSALAFFADVIGDFGRPGELAPDFMPIVAEIAEWEERTERVGSPAAPAAASDGSRETPLTASAVKDVLVAADVVDPDASVTRFEEITGGMSKQAYRLSTRCGAHGKREMIIKRSAGEPLAPIDCMQLAREYGVLKAVSDIGMLVPRPLCLGLGLPGAGGDFYVMEARPGHCTTSFLTTSAPVPKKVMLQIAEQMARLHTLNLAALAGFIEEYEAADTSSRTADRMVARRLERWRELRQSFVRSPSPVEDYLFSWLFANIPENKAPPVLVHGDLVPHNCLWDGDELTAVLDWEGAHFGDPAEDLAYAKPHIERRMDWAEFTAHYEACGGPRIAPRAIEYHSCYSNFRSLLIANVLVTQIPPSSRDLRPLVVDSAFSSMFIDICMSSARNFDRMGSEGERA
ncbi:MAG TPA: phosphotransferase family protein [Stellaceae bacterium]|nr:phosphotransferase family protein [Stellaceae bacterium]